ncbi:trypsin delta-like [Eurosta solidaginis]|uniref:trypsin delta-like n=1 Tax=Eurosta solidaginis TaxID=178769 RepID=UPI0035314003
MHSHMDFALLVVILTCLLAHTNTEYRIIDGGAWRIEKSPYLVSIRFYDINHCVGSLVTMQKVITAANCVKYLDVDRFTVIAGVSDLSCRHQNGQSRGVERVFYPRNYDYDTKHMDIAVMKVRGLFKEGPTVGTIPYSGCSFQNRVHLQVSGWGWTTAENGRTSTILQTTILSSLPYNDCVRRYRTAGRTITQSMICAARGTTDVCVKDTGAPGVAYGLLCAVVSFNQGCANPQYPSVFTVLDNVDVQAFLDEAINGKQS